jgi:plastocyanin
MGLIESCSSLGSLPASVCARAALVSFALLLCLTNEAAIHEVEIEDFLFIPDQLAISAGDTVVWTAKAFEHTVTSDTGLFTSQDIWDYMPFGAKFSHTFQAAGTYPYFCQGHGGPGGSGMSGVVVVSGNSVNRRPNTPANASPLDGAVDQPVAIQLRASAFSDPDSRDFHSASQWLVRRASDSQIAFDSGEDKSNLTNCWAAALAEATAYVWQVRYKDGRGAWSDYSPETRFTTLRPFTQVGIGLKASYYNTANFTAPLAVTTNAMINFAWGTARPHRRITADDFAVRWDGAVLPQFTELYEFQFQYRGRARVWIKNQMIVDEWNGCPFGQTKRGFVELLGGQLASVRIEYGADPAGATAILRWSSPSLSMEIVPAARLFPSVP